MFSPWKRSSNRKRSIFRQTNRSTGALPESSAQRIIIETGHWEKPALAERFYLKLIEMEARGHKTLDNYLNFAKAFTMRGYHTFLASQRDS
jgi:hypothetical protein